jgi:uncharacterized membrane protein YphA (DoxX/SURF4 family)
MKKLFRFLGRALFGAIFLSSAFGHLTQTEALVGYAKAKNAPSPEFTVPLTGGAMLVGTLSILTGWFSKLGALILAVDLIATNYYMHRFWEVEDPQQKQMEMSQFMKNTSLLGATLIVFSLDKTSKSKAPKVAKAVTAEE